MLHDRVITSLKSHSDLSAIYTLLRVKFVEKPQEITFLQIESRVNMLLTDVKQEANLKILTGRWTNCFIDNCILHATEEKMAFSR